jgi:uncharacterized protein YndB with AHSA1/START domain
VADILHDFPIKAPRERVFRGFTAPSDLDQWWTVRSKGAPTEGAEYELLFGPKYDWRATVTRVVPNTEFELKMTRAEPEWVGTRVGVKLTDAGSGTLVHFHHRGWPKVSDNYRESVYCWAMYLRILRRFLERGETVAYEKRLDA